MDGYNSDVDLLREERDLGGFLVSGSPGYAAASPGSAMSPLQPVRLNTARLNVLSPSSRAIGLSSSGNKVCPHNSRNGKPRQPASCKECFDEHNADLEIETNTEMSYLLKVLPSSLKS